MTQFTIRFGKSSSQNYEYAVEYASRFDTYELKGTDKNPEHWVSFSENDINSFFELHELVGRWKSSNSFIDGELLVGNNILWCYKNHLDAFSPEKYCYGLDDGSKYNDSYFGCRHISANPLNYNGLTGYGTMNSKGVFTLNKDKIAHDIDITAKKLGICPAFNLIQMKKDLEILPDKIDPKKDTNWEYVKEYSDGKNKAISVRLKNESDGYELENSSTYYEIQTETVINEVASSKKQSPGCATMLIFALSSIGALLTYFN
ncbi:hypothetical protein [Fictibacillus sp. 18YEL24]|uniref:hypothetical protein n=1 Tax=Fictibacillus sp. 18YEL24 TaxID=2745875 RepID=UPI0018CCDD4B|nr:hypothetical protein [Fictibacillus sp. 18YEL24]MBH0171063.1 hypothetical protein [Fictibacillus sp. 18YEL24]